jgi:hypothetical protein
MDRTQCDWQVIEKGRTYSILECRICSRETAIGPGEKVRAEQFNCPFDEADEALFGSQTHSDQTLGDKL